MKVYSLSSRSPEQPCHFHGCLRHALRVARWLGFFPVQGLGEIRPEGIRFKIKSFYSIYAVATLLGQVLMSYFSLLLFFQTEVTLSSIYDEKDLQKLFPNLKNDHVTIFNYITPEYFPANIVFYVTSLITNILLLKLAQQWPFLMTKAVETERGLTELTLDHKVAGRSSVLAYLVMALAMVEHILCTSFNIKFVMYCLQEAGVTTNVMENYVVHRMPYIFNYIPYSFFSAIFFEYLCLQSTFLWSFNDVIITCFSIYITAYFKTLNAVIATNVKKDKDGIPWSILRVHYSNLVKLVKEIDDHISSLILLSFFTDLFYICLQLFNSLHRNHVSFKYCDETQTNQALSSPFYLLYYLYSFVFLVLRALMLSLFASNVHCAALEPVYSVYDVPSSVYDNEVRRFQLQLHYTEVGLSGKFFYVTRNMILKVVGTIITYEIVLLQYSVTPNPYYNVSTTIPTTVDNATLLYTKT